MPDGLIDASTRRATGARIRMAYSPTLSSPHIKEWEANRENRRIIAGLVQRVPELEGPRESRDAPETASEDVGKGASVPPEPQEPTERRSWWRRFFGIE
jgi:hypothetical protein